MTAVNSGAPASAEIPVPGRRSRPCTLVRFERLGAEPSGSESRRRDGVMKTFIGIYVAFGAALIISLSGCGSDGLCSGGDCQCLAGESCDFDCDSAGCNQQCAGDCEMTCEAGDCDQQCSTGSDCLATCAGGGCEQQCSPGARS